MVVGPADADRTESSRRALIDGKIYVVGGGIGSTLIIGLSNKLSTNEAYDVAKDTWSAALGMPTPRSGIGVAVLNGRMHVLGGEAYLNDLVGTYRTHEAYDPKNDSWQRLPPMPTPRHGLAVAEVGGKMYAVSGSNVAGGGGPHEGVNVNEVYEPSYLAGWRATECRTYRRLEARRSVPPSYGRINQAGRGLPSTFGQWVTREECGERFRHAPGIDHL